MATLPTVNFPTIQLTAEQAQQFTESEGVILANELGEVLALIHYSDVNKPVSCVEKEHARNEARALVALLECLVSNQATYLDLNDRAISGLSLMLSEIQDRLSV